MATISLRFFTSFRALVACSRVLNINKSAIGVFVRGAFRAVRFGEEIVRRPACVASARRRFGGDGICQPVIIIGTK